MPTGAGQGNSDPVEVESDAVLPPHTHLPRSSDMRVNFDLHVPNQVCQERLRIPHPHACKTSGLFCLLLPHKDSN